MGKEWDGGDISYQPETWAEVMRVLKPGGHMLCFGGTKSFHRIAVAIEDAGFELRDTIMWLYGCLDDKTQALTKTGWKSHTELSTADQVAQWDHETGEITWVNPEVVVRYPFKGMMKRLVNRHTDQLLTPNHRVYGRIRTHARNAAPTCFEVREAWELRDHWQIDLPVAGTLEEGCNGPSADIAYIVGWWLTDAWRHGDGKAAMFSQAKPDTLEKLRGALRPYNPSEYKKIRNSENHNDEYSFYLTGPLADRLLTEFPDRKLTWDVLSWNLSARKALLEGLMDGDGSMRPTQHCQTFWSKNSERREVFLALASTLGFRVLERAEKGCVHLNPKTTTTQIQYKHRTSAQFYEGTVWCVRVPKGAFVCRRGAGVFITGNSGFPKSHDVSKAIDKHLGVERPVISTEKVRDIRNGHGRGQGDGMHAANREGGPTYIDRELTAPGSPETHQWEGWGSSLKPSYEPVILARKPLEGTIAANTLKWGVGGINIDASRVGIDENDDIHAKNPHTQNKGKEGGWCTSGGTGSGYEVPTGRFPANVIHDGSDEVEAVFAAYGKKNGGHYPSARGKGGISTSGHSGQDNLIERGSDTGTAARFFYSAKAGKEDRGGSKHPTVKPQALMRYLVKLITPPGGTVLDCFAGSGSTGVAAMAEGFNTILCEREDEYVADIARRIPSINILRPAMETDLIAA